MMLDMKLPQEILDWIKDEAERREVTKAEVVRSLILTGYAFATADLSADD